MIEISVRNRSQKAILQTTWLIRDFAESIFLHHTFGHVFYCNVVVFQFVHSCGLREGKTNFLLFLTSSAYIVFFDKILFMVNDLTFFFSDF